MFYDTGDARDVMYGVLYQFDSAEKDRLDQLEGRGKGYNEQFVSIPLNGETYGPHVYVAASTHIDPSLVPYDWYKEMVLLGARYHTLAADFIAKIETVPAVPDPDPERAR